MSGAAIDTTKLLCGYQKRWLLDDAPLALWEKSRRIGATWVHALRVVLGRIARPIDRGGSHYYHSSADQTASVEFIDYCAHWARWSNAVAKIGEETEVIDDREITSLVMRFANGTKIVAGTSNPKFFRSKGGEVGLDEFAFHRDGRELYKAAHATAMFWGYPLRAWSDAQRAREPTSTCHGEARRKAGRLKAGLHRTTIEDAVADGIVERIIMRKQKLDHVPAPDEGAPAGVAGRAAGHVPRPGHVERGVPLRAVERRVVAAQLRPDPRVRARRRADLKVVEDPRQLKTNGRCTLGWDVGRKHDLSASGGWPRSATCSRRGCSSDSRRDFTARPGAVLLTCCMARPTCERLCIDATGIGNMLAGAGAAAVGEVPRRGR
jgi:phage FluMu gp28-like protein